MKTRPAFTLIELLVAVAVIGVLIGLLLPALGAARDNAKAVRCGTQIRQMASAQFSHAADSNGHFVHGAPSHPGITGAMDAYTIWDGGVGPTRTRGWVGIGLLWRQGYVDSLQLAWCPLWSAPKYQYDDPTYGFSVDPAIAIGHGDQVAWSYHYRSAMDADDGDPRPAHVDDDDSDDPFVSDAFTEVPAAAVGGGATGPAKHFAHRDGFNVGYIDGSVTYLVDYNDVLTNDAPAPNEHEDAESDVWEAYLERTGEYFLGGPNGGMVYVDDGE